MKTWHTHVSSALLGLPTDWYTMCGNISLARRSMTFVDRKYCEQKRRDDTKNVREKKIEHNYSKCVCAQYINTYRLLESQLPSSQRVSRCDIGSTYSAVCTQLPFEILLLLLLRCFFSLQTQIFSVSLIE